MYSVEREKERLGGGRERERAHKSLWCFMHSVHIERVGARTNALKVLSFLFTHTEERQRESSNALKGLCILFTHREMGGGRDSDRDLTKDVKGWCILFTVRELEGERDHTKPSV